VPGGSSGVGAQALSLAVAAAWLLPFCLFDRPRANTNETTINDSVPPGRICDGRQQQAPGHNWLSTCLVTLLLSQFICFHKQSS